MRVEMKCADCELPAANCLWLIVDGPLFVADCWLPFAFPQLILERRKRHLFHGGKTEASDYLTMTLAFPRAPFDKRPTSVNE